MKNLLPVVAVMLLTLSASIASWRWDSPQPQGNKIFAAARADDSGSVIVAVGDFGTVLRRSLPGSWENAGPIAGGRALSSIVADRGALLAVGPDAGLWQSQDSAGTWTPLDEGVRGRWLLPLSNGALLCLGADSCHLRTGSSFVSVPLAIPRSARIAAAAREGVAVVAGAEGAIARTTDGVNWVYQTLSGNPYLYALASGPSGFLAVGYDTAQERSAVYLSAQGSDWQRLDLPEALDFVISVNAAHDGFLLQGQSGTSRSGSLYLLSGGIWKPLESPAFDFYASASCLADDVTLLFGERGLILSLAPGGSALTTVIGSPIVSGFLYAPFFGVAASGDLCVALDLNGQPSPIFTTDGSLWQQPSPPALAGAGSLLAVDGAIVAHGGVSSPGFYRTTDGAGWELLKPTPDAANIRSFAANSAGSALVAIARDDVLLGSTYTARRTVYHSDGWQAAQPLSALPDAAWQESQPPDFSVMEDVRWDGSRFVMLLYPGRVFVSPDGRDWTRLPPLPSPDVAAVVASGGGAIVARAVRLDADGTYPEETRSGDETVYVFSDGRWWPRRIGVAPSPENLQALWDGQQFCLLGRGEIFTSPDGWRWSRQALPAPLAALAWSGTRLFGFTDSFAVLSRGERLPAGTPVEEGVLEPQVYRSPAAGVSYNLVLTNLAASEPWQLSGLPSWITADRVSGNGAGVIRLTVSANVSDTPRGAVLSVAGASHLVGQDGAKTASAREVGAAATTLKVPFAGIWSAAVDGAAEIAGGLAGTKPPVVRIPANTSTAPREFSVNLNGVPYTITQQGRPESELRAGSYAGPVGYVTGLPSPASLPPIDAYESFEGEIRFAVTGGKPGSGSGGTYSVSLVWHDGARLWKAKGKGSVLPDGRIADFELRSGDQTFALRNVSLNLLGDGFADATGVLRVRGVDFVFRAGKNPHRETPLPSARTGLHTFVLDATAAGPPAAAGSWTMGSDGIARFSLRLAGGAKATCSAPTWTGVDGRTWLPFTALVAPARVLVGGYVASLAAGELPVGWSLEGFADRKGVQEPFTDSNGNLIREPDEDFVDLNGNGAWDSGVANLWSRAGRYAPPAAGQTALRWPAAGRLVVSSPESDAPLLTAKVRLDSGRLVFSDLSPGEAKWKLAFNPKTGLVSGSLALPEETPLAFFGVIDQNFQSVGRVLGFATKGGDATFSVIPD